MKKVFTLVLIVLCIAFIGTAIAAAQSQKLSTKQVLVDRNNDTKIDGIDVYDENGKVAKRGYDTNNDMVIDKWETYDENTGMPIATESDKAFELR